MSDAESLSETEKLEQIAQELDSIIESESSNKTDPSTPPEDHPVSSLSVGVPNAVKFGLPALFIGLVASLYLVVTAVSDGTTVEDVAGFPLSGKPAVVDPAVNRHAIEPDVVEVDSMYMPDLPDRVGESTTEHHNADDTKPLPGYSFEAMNDRFHTIEQSIAGITARLETLAANFERLPSVDTSNIAQDEVDNAITTFQAQLDALQQQVSGHSSFIHNTEKQQAETPPFSLLSVDQWGGQYCAVLSMAGKDAFAYQGDIRAGWLIKEFVSTTRIRVCKQGANHCAELVAPGP